MDSIGSSETRGGIVRALVKGGWGYATLDDLGDLAERVKEAAEGETFALTWTGRACEVHVY